jgi:hypothetical protein
VKAIAGVALGGDGVVVVAVVVSATGEVVGTAVTGVLTVLVGHVVAVVPGVPQLGPLQKPVLVMMPVASDALAVTEKVRV